LQPSATGARPQTELRGNRGGIQATVLLKESAATAKTQHRPK